MNRRGILRGLLAAPFVIRTPGLLMPIKALHEGFEFSGFYSTIPREQFLDANLLNELTRRIIFENYQQDLVHGRWLCNHQNTAA